MPKDERKTFQATIYSLEPLPRELRAEFKLPAYPFANGLAGPLPEDVTKFFREHSIVHYRDELKRVGIMCQPDDGDETPIFERSGFQAYRQIVVLLYRGMRAAKWNPNADPEKHRKLVKKHGDDFAWMRWNEPVIVVKMSEKVVQT